MRKRLLASALLLGMTFGTALQASHYWYCGSSAYHYPWLNIYYKNNATNSAPKAYKNILQSELGGWDSATCLNFTSTTPDLTMNAAFYGSTGWLGLATLDSLSGCHVIKASSLLNRSYLDSSSYSSTNVSHVACQEIGHTFGLNHNQSSTTTCMNDTILTAPYPNQHDIDAIRSLYAHHGCN